MDIWVWTNRVAKIGWDGVEGCGKGKQENAST
jgi:hypothetical protein